MSCTSIFQQSVSAQHSEARGGADIHPDCVRYLGGFNDELLRKGGASLVFELQTPTSSGRLLAESVALALTARIAERYAGVVRRGTAVTPRHMLTEHRLRRVLQYMAEHVEDDIGLDDLAAVAGLSVFHFNRMFANACECHRTAISVRCGWNGQKPCLR